MRARRVARSAVALLALAASGFGAAPAHAARLPAAANEPADPAIAAALKLVSPARIEATVAHLVSFGTRSSLSAQDESAIAEGRGIGAAREWIRAELERYSEDCGGCLEVSLDSFEQPAAKRVLSRLKYPASILFLAVAGEEQGMLGSAHFARMARERQWSNEAVLNNDIVGGDRSPGQDAHVVRVFSEGIPSQTDEAALRRLRLLGAESDSPSRELARYIAETDAVYGSGAHPMLVFRLDRYLRGGDHEPFNDQGFSAVRLTEFREDFTHQHQDVRTENGLQYGDRIAHVNVEYIARVARLNAATLASLASAPAAPANVQLATARLENDSSLSWDAAANASGYELLWRATDSPQWQHVQRVGSDTRVTVPISKDNVIFGVRAVDAAGHRSLAVLPLPVR